MSPTNALHDPRTESAHQLERASDSPLTTYRVEVEHTGRVLLQGFHIEISVTDAPGQYSLVAEFGDEDLALRVIEKLAYRARLVVRAKQWPTLEGTPLNALCRRVSDTGASANMLFWNPRAANARALMDMPRLMKESRR